jgi:membrane-bound lytic murein transglycosylase MltF
LFNRDGSCSTLPARILDLRSKAANRGLDPNRWFANVEQIAAEEIGRETLDYVANINKYYLQESTGNVVAG